MCIFRINPENYSVYKIFFLLKPLVLLLNSVMQLVSHKMANISLEIKLLLLKHYEIPAAIKRF